MTLGRNPRGAMLQAPGRLILAPFALLALVVRYELTVDWTHSAVMKHRHVCYLINHLGRCFPYNIPTPLRQPGASRPSPRVLYY